MLIVIRDEAGKIVSIQPIDLKTMNGSTLKFISNLKSFRYDIQAAWYLEALFAPDSTFSIEKDVVIEDVLKPFMFIVESNTFPGQPLVYVTDVSIVLIGKYGKPELMVKDNNNPDSLKEILKQKVVGFDELVDTYIYQSENEWREEKVITDNNGVLNIDWNGIK